MDFKRMIATAALLSCASGTAIAAGPAMLPITKFREMSPQQQARYVDGALSRIAGVLHQGGRDAKVACMTQYLGKRRDGQIPQGVKDLRHALQVAPPSETVEGATLAVVNRQCAIMPKR